MEEEQKLTKREKRALAKEEKRKARKKENLMNTLRKLFYILVIGGILVGGTYYLAKSGSGGSEGAKEEFVSYAQGLNLNVEEFEADLESDEIESRVNSDITQGNSQGVNATPTFFLNGEKLQNPRNYDDFRALVNGVILDSENRVSFEVGQDDRVKGNVEAGVVLIEYADFQCPACASYYPLVKQLGEDFPDELLIVFRHYPLVSIHKNALLSARAAEAAANQGKFWEMHDKLFEGQNDWSNLR